MNLALKVRFKDLFQIFTVKKICLKRFPETLRLVIIKEFIWCSYTSTTKKALPIEQLFGQHIYNITHVNNLGKPRPDIFLHAAKQLDIDPIACIVIEDSAHGIKAAKAAGMFCIGINTHGNPDQLKEADLIINGYHEIDLIELIYLKKG